MKIGFVGAGKVGFTLGKYFKEHGKGLTGYYSRNPESAKEAAGFTGTKHFASLESILAESDALFLTVPDTAIKSVWDSLKAMPIHHKMICHCSGALSSGVFDDIEHKQAFGYSIHPFFSVSSKLTSYKTISQAFFTLEGSEQHIDDIKHFIEGMGNPVHIIGSDQKVLYHAAAVFLSNHVAALAYTGCKLLKECGFEEEFTEAALKTLFFNQCREIAENGTVKALTGPVERNDSLTVKKHLNCLAGNEKNLYGSLSTQLIEIAKEKHNNNDYSALELLIKEEMGVLI